MTSTRTKAKTDKPDATEPKAGQVAVTLAHPLTAEQSVPLGLPAADHQVGDEVWLWPATARAVINSGYAQIDPMDKTAVAAALTPGQTAEPGAEVNIAPPGAALAP